MCVDHISMTGPDRRGRDINPGVPETPLRWADHPKDWFWLRVLLVTYFILLLNLDVDPLVG